MTEAEWLACEDAQQMMAFLQHSRRPGDRKLLLFVGGFWRWQAGGDSRAKLSAADRDDLRKRAEAMEFWAENGKLPRGVRKARNPRSVIFFGEAPTAARMTAHAPAYWFNENGQRARQFQPPLVRCVFGNPFRPVSERSFPPHVVGLAQAVYAAFPDVSPDYAILADALEELGEAEAAAHCRQGFHARGCHVLDWCLNKE
jgi:hypothetical protein